MIGSLPDVRMGFVRNKIIINFFLKKKDILHNYIKIIE